MIYFYYITGSFYTKYGKYSGRILVLHTPIGVGPIKHDPTKTLEFDENKQIKDINIVLGHSTNLVKLNDHCIDSAINIYPHSNGLIKFIPHGYGTMYIHHQGCSRFNGNFDNGKMQSGDLLCGRSFDIYDLPVALNNFIRVQYTNGINLNVCFIKGDPYGNFTLSGLNGDILWSGTIISKNVWEMTHSSMKIKFTGCVSYGYPHNGTMTFPNGDVFEGEFLNNLPKCGKMIFSNGNAHE